MTGQLRRSHCSCSIGITALKCRTGICTTIVLAREWLDQAATCRATVVLTNTVSKTEQRLSKDAP
jgi:hypothetical protein